LSAHSLGLLGEFLHSPELLVLADENDPIARGQQALDWAWEQKLAAQARRRRSVIPETGEYDPIRRLDSELDYAQELADRRFARGF
jgi:hypothetical protein